MHESKLKLSELVNGNSNPWLGSSRPKKGGNW